MAEDKDKMPWERDYGTATATEDDSEAPWNKDYGATPKSAATSSDQDLGEYLKHPSSSTSAETPEQEGLGSKAWKALKFATGVQGLESLSGGLGKASDWLQKKAEEQHLRDLREAAATGTSHAGEFTNPETGYNIGASLARLGAGLDSSRNKRARHCGVRTLGSSTLARICWTIRSGVSPSRSASGLSRTRCLSTGRAAALISSGSR